MTTRTLDLEPLDATFGAVVHGVTLRTSDDALWPVLREAWLEHALLIFSGQFLTPDEQNDVARRFGKLEFPAAPITNIGRDGFVHSQSDDDIVKSIRGNEGWHHDSTYMPVQAKGAVFSAEIIPSAGAATGFADMRAAYDALDDATRQRITGMSAYHSIEYSQGRAGYLPSKRTEDGNYAQYGYSNDEAKLRPLVKVHPETGRANLLIGRHAHAVVGLEADASEALLDELNEWACDSTSRRVHHHDWTVGDTVVWDNRRLMHRATPFDLREPRRMWHTRIAGERPSELAANYA